jgi:hypothetical protein
MYYNVHYPNGIVKKHLPLFSNQRLPGLEKVFYNGNNYYVIVEISERDVWVESISLDEYYKTIGDTETSRNNYCCVFNYYYGCSSVANYVFNWICFGFDYIILFISDFYDW